jgi:RNA polymerase sigma-70 factor (ECF subfamily)
MSESWRTRRTLLVRAQDQNDELAWEEFTAYYQDFIVIILRKMGMNPNYLDDIVQETLIKIWKGLTRFDLKDEKSKFRAWLKTVIRNTAYTCYNKQKKHHIQNTTLENIE